MRLIDADILKEELKDYKLIRVGRHGGWKEYNTIHEELKKRFEKMIDEQPTAESDELILNLKQAQVISDMFDERLKQFYEIETLEVIPIVSALITILNIMYKLESISLDYYSSTTQSILNSWKEIENKYKID